ncbi:MAG: hypothetical protein ABSE49_13315 [Polyangiaceae bacterium]|jgi:hypothetical protein
MLVEGVCVDGHELVCVIQHGRVSGVLSRGALRDACPVCGGTAYVTTESGTVPVSSKIPSERPPPAAEEELRQGRGR